MARVSVRNRNKNRRDLPANWEYRFEIARVDGHRRSLSKCGFKTKKEALTAGTRALAEYNGGVPVVQASSVSLIDFCDYWYDNFATVNLRPNTQAAYRNLIDNLFRPQLASYRLTALSAAAVQLFVNDLKKAGYSRSYVYGAFSLLSEILEYAIEPMHLIAYNPCAHVRFPSFEKKPRERIVLTLDQWDYIIHRFPFGHRFHVPLMLGFYCGLRVAECCGLTWDDVDLDSCTLHINKQLVHHDGSWWFAPLKTARSYRSVAFSPDLVAVLKKEEERQQANMARYGSFYVSACCSPANNKNERQVALEPVTGWDVVRFVCVYESGQPVTSDSLRYCNRELKKAVPGFDYHCLRHSHATYLVQGGANIKAIQARLGHERIETTLQTYAHTTSDLDQEAVGILDQLIKK